MKRLLWTFGASAGVLATFGPLAAGCSSSGGGATSPDGGHADASALDGGPLDAPVSDVTVLDVSVDALPPPTTFCGLPGSVLAEKNGVVIVPGAPAGTPDLRWLQVPQGFCAHYFGNVGDARQIRFAPGGEAFVASPTASTTGGGPGGLGGIAWMADDNHDGFADGPATLFLSGVAETQGLLFASSSLYYQDGPIVRKLPYTTGQRSASGPGAQIADITVYVSHLHWPKPIDLADDGTLYVGNGSDQGEVCYASRPFVGGVLKLDGTPGGTQFAKGFRNPIGLRCQRGHDRCFAAEMTLDYSEAQGGREKIVEVKPGDFGYPCCATTGMPFGGVMAQTDGGSMAPDCSGIQAEVVSLHVGRSPMSLAFAPASWPSPWAGRMLVALHGAFGTWQGAEVIGIDVDGTGMPMTTSEVGLDAGDRPATESGFAAGWDDGAHDHGRPDDLDVAPDGRLFLTNDVTGDIVWFAPVGLAAGADGGAP